ncbi:hypothetical protein YC2023_060455 [Brassica napus]
MVDGAKLGSAVRTAVRTVRTGTRVRELAHGWLMIVQDRLDVAGKKETKAGYVSGQRYGQIHKAVWSISSQAFPHPIRSIQPATNTPRPDPDMFCSLHCLVYHCLSLTKDVPGQFLASLRWLRSLSRRGDPNHFSKMAVKSVERGRLQTGSMKRVFFARFLVRETLQGSKLGSGSPRVKLKGEYIRGVWEEMVDGAKLGSAVRTAVRTGTRVRELAHGSDWLMIVQDRLDVAGKKETKGGYVSGQRYGQIHKAVWSISSQAFPHPIRSIQPATNTPRPDPERPFQTRLPPLSISYP